MKVIKDIRVYKSNIENIDGNSLPYGFADKHLNTIIHRIVMKLRENKFSLGEFDHLYLNFTTCLQEGIIKPSQRSIDRYHSFYRFYDIGVSEELFRNMERGENDFVILNLLERTLLQYFSSDNSETMIKESINIAVSQGEKMLIHYKEKKSSKNTAIIFLSYLDSAEYQPILCIYDSEENEIMRENLPLTMDLLSVGEIQLSSKKVTIKPRKNVLAKNLKPVSFEF